MRNSIHTRALQRAADLFGGSRRLAQQLNISRVRIDVWLRGEAPVPGEVFLAVVDLLLAYDLAILHKPVEHQPSGAADKSASPTNTTDVS